MSQEEILNELNSTISDLLLVDIDALGSRHLSILKRTKQVINKDSQFYNLKGIEFQIDADWIHYEPTFVGGSSGVLIPYDEQNPPVIKCGEEAMIEYLKQVNQWEQGLALGVEENFQSWLKTISLYVDNKLR